MLNCKKIECIWNEGSTCTRNEILVDSIIDLTGKKVFVCRCFSNEKISGHLNWSALLNSDGTAKGGSVDDAYANRLAAEKKKTKSYRTHMNQK